MCTKLYLSFKQRARDRFRVEDHFANRLSYHFFFCFVLFLSSVPLLKYKLVVFFFPLIYSYYLVVSNERRRRKKQGLLASINKNFVFKVIKFHIFCCWWCSNLFLSLFFIIFIIINKQQWHKTPICVFICGCASLSIAISSYSVFFLFLSKYI